MTSFSPRRWSRVPDFLQLDLRTKLLLMMSGLLVVSSSALFVLHLSSEQRLLSQVHDYTAELATAVAIVQEQPVTSGDPQVVLKAYAQRLRRLGVKDVSITDASEEVQASTNPGNLGKKLSIRTTRGPREFLMRGVLGEETTGNRKVSTLTIPLVVGDERVGHLVVTCFLDDFSTLSREALYRLLLATLSVFGLGMIASSYLSWSFSRPLGRFTEAARRVSDGDLTVRLAPEGGREIRLLAESFNEMVDHVRERRSLEERLHFAERSTALGRLASAVAHEIRNPLNLISLSIDHLRQCLRSMKQPPRQELDRVLHNVKEEIGRLNRLVNHFLSFGKPTHPRVELCLVDGIVQQVATLVAPKAREQNVELDVQLAGSASAISCDPELLKTCFLNLMINALDAMPRGGRLSVTIAPSDEQLSVTFADSGHGMSSEDLANAFQPYYSTKNTGLGIGLALTRQIVTDHRGQIRIDSTYGRGTTVEILLPMAQQPSIALP